MAEKLMAQARHLLSLHQELIKMNLEPDTLDGAREIRDCLADFQSECLKLAPQFAKALLKRDQRTS